MAYTIDKAKELVLKAGMELCEAGLVARTWGNISARVSETQYVITPSGRAYDTLQKEDIVLVNIADGEYEGEVKPSGEKGVHAIVYELCPEINFVIHTHQNYASALSILGREIQLESGILPCAGYGMYATQELVDNIKEQIKTHKAAKAVLMKYHGALCYGKDYEEAFLSAYQLEDACKKVYEKLCNQNQRINESNENSITEKAALVYPDALEKVKAVLEARDGMKAVLHTRTPYILKMSCLGKTMFPYLDDIAQIAGTDVACAAFQEKDDTEDLETATLRVTNALKGKNAVFIKGAGAICSGFDESEAEATALVLEKACMAAYLAECLGNIAPLDAEIARMDRECYMSYYSKLK